MRVLRFAFPAILFAVILVGCIVQADTYSDQNPFSAPDTLQSSGDGPIEESGYTPLPTATPEPTAAQTPAATPTIDKWDVIPTGTPVYPPPTK